MCIFHKWSKWEQYAINGTYFPYASSTGHEFGERRQKRHCEKCNKEQDKKVR